MIKFQDQVPAVYPSASRDFQYLCWLMNIVLNSVKHNVDALYDLPNSKADARLTELLAMTLGFKVKRNYDQKQLEAIVAALPRILKYKGTKTAIDMAGHALIAASGASGDFSSKVENGELVVTLPVELVDISLFTDLLTYILPAGMTYHIKRENRKIYGYTTELTYNAIPIAQFEPDFELKPYDNYTFNDEPFGISTLFNVGSSAPTMANYLDYGPTKDDPAKLNAGLLDNSIIPIIHETAAQDNTELDTNILDN